MHVDTLLVEFVTTGEQEYEEVIKEYVEEVLVQKGALEPPVTDFADTPPVQDKPRCITLIFNNHWIYMCIYICVCDVHLRYRLIVETTCIDISTYESY